LTIPSFNDEKARGNNNMKNPPLAGHLKKSSYRKMMDKITNIHWLSKEDVGFEPTHAFTCLTVFKTVPFSQAWVILH
jgi:hypothetical protein